MIMHVLYIRLYQPVNLPTCRLLIAIQCVDLSHNHLELLLASLESSQDFLAYSNLIPYCSSEATCKPEATRDV